MSKKKEHLQAPWIIYEKREELELDFMILREQMWSPVISISLGLIWGYRSPHRLLALQMNESKNSLCHSLEEKNISLPRMEVQGIKEKYFFIHSACTIYHALFKGTMRPSMNLNQL